MCFWPSDNSSQTRSGSTWTLCSLFVDEQEREARAALDEVNEKSGKSAVIYRDAGSDQTSKIAYQRLPKAK
jgi:hypothetical protein